MVLIQGLNSVSTVVQMVVFAIVLPRSEFDNYAVWFTSAQLLVGLGQAIGSDRVVLGRRSLIDGRHAARVLALVVGLAQIGVALAIGSLPLVLCSLCALAFVSYDYERMVRCFDEPRWFLRRDIIVIVLQVAVVTAAALIWGRSGWLIVGWWGAAVPLWFGFGSRLPAKLRTGVRVLVADARETAPLLVDSVLAGLPMVAFIALIRVQGSEGDASAVRMALTILGPVSVLGLAGRRLVYQRASRGPFEARFTALWSAVVGAVFVLCVGLLMLTRTPLYPWAFSGFEALSWLAILGFSINHAAFFATFLSSATLRADGRSGTVLLARSVGIVATAVAALALAPFDDPSDVGWCLAVAGVGYAVALSIGVRRPDAGRVRPAALS